MYLLGCAEDKGGLGMVEYSEILSDRNGIVIMGLVGSYLGTCW